MERNILVIDDDPGIQETLVAIFKDEGYHVAIAADGAAALSYLERATPSAIVLDLMMPRMDGFVFMEELRRRGLHPRVPVIVLTAAVGAEQPSLQLGAASFLEKPFSIDSLLQEVARLISAADT